MSLEGFRFRYRQEVVLRDLDGFGHVNNAVYLTYVENARVAYLKDVVGAVWLQEIRNIMASVKIDYRGQASYRDELEIGVKTERIGNTSFQLAYRIVRGSEELVADVTSVQVAFDFDAGSAIAVPQQWRAAIAAYEAMPGLLNPDP